MRSKVHIFTDGGSRGNPGPGSGAFIAVISPDGKNFHGGKVVGKDNKYLGIRTNNESEYMALIMALEWTGSRGIEEIVIHSDSQLMIRQLTGEYRVKSGRIKPLYRRVVSLLGGFEWKAIHHTRDHPWIEECDLLVNRVLDRH